MSTAVLLGVGGSLVPLSQVLQQDAPLLVEAGVAHLQLVLTLRLPRHFLLQVLQRESRADPSRALGHCGKSAPDLQPLGHRAVLHLLQPLEGVPLHLGLLHLLVDVSCLLRQSSCPGLKARKDLTTAAGSAHGTLLSPPGSLL